jgi:hypothetical protein
VSRINIGLGLVLLAALALAAYQDAHPPWARAGSDTVVQITTVAGRVDRCPTCHRAVLDPKLARKQHPLRPHPRVEGHPPEDLARSGCTPCHGGQGRRLDREAHGPGLGGGPDPFLPKRYRQARCARCHVPTTLVGAEDLELGIQLYLEAACSGCHQPGRLDEGLGPDLRRLGRRTEAELRQALLDPREGHDAAVMWSLRWRFDQKTEQGRRQLAALLAALLALGDDPAPYRPVWANPTLRVDVSCTTCHREVSAGGKTVGRPHRCSLLHQRDALRCVRCHRADDAKTQVQARGRECPEVQAARSLCPVCHLRSGDGAAAPAR